MTCRNSHFHINYNIPCLAPKHLALALFSSSPGRIVNPKRNWKQWLCKTFGDKQGVLWECESSCDGSKVSRPCHSFGLAVLGPSEESLRGVWTQITRVEGCHVIKNRVWFEFVRATVGVRVRVIVGVGSEKYSWYAFRNSFKNKNVRTALYL